LKNHSAYMLLNIIIQLSAMFAYQSLMVIWPLYILIGLLSILVFVQTLAAAAVFGMQMPFKGIANDETRDHGLNFLVSITYLASCYQLYIAGFEIFSVVAATHATILMLALILRGIK
jgi:hypothetical protein